MKIVNLIGQRFGRLTVVGRAENIGKQTAWLCLCDCGGSVSVRYRSLAKAETKSCGCLRSEKMKAAKQRHGHYNSRTYHSYHSMKARCLNKNHRQFKDYGGRGIGISDRWLDSFENFLADMGERPVGRTLDRINNDLGYSKSNCRWATREEQNNNKR